MEEWRDIEGFEGLYQISNTGRVKNKRNGSIKATRVNKKTGYVITDLKAAGKKTTCYVHRLVAIAFIPNPDTYPVINHKDENRQNNHASNLEWCTQKYNVHYGSGIEKNRLAHIGKRASAETRKKQSEAHSGEKHWNYGRTWSQETKKKNMVGQPKRKMVVNLSTGEVFDSISDAARKSNTASSSIARVCNGVYKKANGYVWGWFYSG